MTHILLMVYLWGSILTIPTGKLYNTTNPEFLTISETAESDRSVRDVLIYSSDSVKVIRNTKFFRYGLDKIDYSILKNYILSCNIKKDKKCDYFGGLGSISIKIYENNNCYCYYAKDDEAVVILLGLLNQSIFLNMSVSLQDHLERLLVRIVGIDKYKKSFNPTYDVSKF